MHMPYENQLLGAFLYAFGYHGGQSHAAPVSANLFQQTPLDQTFGDLIVGASHCLALEFKRDERSLKSERLKWQEDDIEKVRSDQALYQVAEKAHFVVYAIPGAQGIELRCAQYYQCIRPTAPLQTHPVQPLIKAIHSGPKRAQGPLGVSPAELEWYLRQLEDVKRKTSGGRSSDQTTWLAVAHNPSGLQFMTAQSLTQLLELEHEHVPTSEPSLSRSRDRGYDLGM